MPATVPTLGSSVSRCMSLGLAWASGVLGRQLAAVLCAVLVMIRKVEGRCTFRKLFQGKMACKLSCEGPVKRG